MIRSNDDVVDGIEPEHEDELDAAITTAFEATRDMVKDAERWRKFCALMQMAYDSPNDVDIAGSAAGLSLAASMIFGRKDKRRVQVVMGFTDNRDAPLNLAAALDEVDLRQVRAEMGEEPGGP